MLKQVWELDIILTKKPLIKIPLFLLVITSLCFGNEPNLEFVNHNTKTIEFSKTTIPYMTKHTDRSAMNAYNNNLKQIISGLKCTKKVKNKNQTFYETRTSIQYLRHDLISVRITSDYNCDGLHPYSGQDRSLLFDLKNHRKLVLTDLFFKKAETLKFIKLKLKASVTDKSCHDKAEFYIESERLFEDHLDYYLTKTGITFNLKLPYGIRFCSEKFSLSFKEILSNMAYTNIFKRIEKDYKN
jgi:hypothetical protein